MKLPSELATLIDERERARDAYSASRNPSAIVTGISDLLSAKRGELTATKDVPSAAALHGEIAGLEMALAKASAPPREDDVQAARQTLIVASAAVGKSASAFHRERCATHWADFEKALGSAFDALDAIADDRIDVEAAVGVGIDEPKLLAARQLLCGLADATGVPMRPASAKESARNTRN